MSKVAVGQENSADIDNYEVLLAACLRVITCDRRGIGQSSQPTVEFVGAEGPA